MKPMNKLKESGLMLGAFVFLAMALSSTPAHAQTFTTIKNFTHDDGSTPQVDLAYSNGFFYGACAFGGSSNLGTLYKVSTNGTGYTVLKNFTGTDGADVQAGLTLVDGVLYGTAYQGSTDYSSFSQGSGIIFSVRTDGTGYTVLKYFGGSDGSKPQTRLVFLDGMLYGATVQGGSNNNGTLFKISTNGFGYTVLYNFNNFTHDGRGPAGLTLSGGVLYGTTTSGGAGYGTIYKINTDGSGYTVLKSFNFNDGSNPQTGITFLGGAMYGATTGGGSSGNGVLYKMNVNGSNYTVLRNFNGSDGGNSYTTLTSVGNVLYGTTFGGGGFGYGTVFSMNADGSGYSVIKNFTAPTGSFTTNSDGAHPWEGGMIFVGGALYGTAQNGGSTGNGTIFKIDPSIPMSARLISNALVISWTNATFTLQSAPSLSGVYTNVPGATSPYTNATTGPQKFFRLINN